MAATEITELDEAASDFASDIRRRILELPDPDPIEVFAHAYAEPHSAIEQQRLDYLDFEASLSEEYSE